MLQGYFDDSGSDGQKPPFVLAGFILPAERWADFADAWIAECHDKPRIEYFKMSEAASFDGQFALMHEDIRDYKVRRLAELINKHALHGMNTWLLWEEYRKFNLGLEGPAKNQPYANLFFGLLENIVSYERELNWFPRKIQIDVDQQGAAGAFAINSYHEMVGFSETFDIPLDIKEIVEGTPRMLDDKQYMGLQAADMLAWCVRHAIVTPDWENGRWAWLCRDIFKSVWPACNRFGPANWDAYAQALIGRGPVANKEEAHQQLLKMYPNIKQAAPTKWCQHCLLYIQVGGQHKADCPIYM